MYQSKIRLTNLFEESFLWRYFSLWQVICFYVLLCVHRLELQYGLSIPVPQLEGVCGRMCPALCGCGGGSYLHAWKSQILPGGEQIFLSFYDVTHPESAASVISLWILWNTDTHHCHLFYNSKEICKNISGSWHFLINLHEPSKTLEGGFTVQNEVVVVTFIILPHLEEIK